MKVEMAKDQTAGGQATAAEIGEWVERIVEGKGPDGGVQEEIVTGTFSLQLLLFAGMPQQARTLVRELLGRRLHPVFIVRNGVVPAVEASCNALKNGSLQVGQLPGLGRSLHAVMEEIKSSLGKGGLSLHFLIGRAWEDVFDLWGSVITEAFDAAGFRTFRNSELNRCEAITVCEIVSARLVRGYVPAMRTAMAA